MPPSYGYAYPSMPDYYVEDWDVEDIYPYPEIRVMEPPGPPGEIVVVIPGIGSLYVTLPDYDGWVFDPGIVQVYAGTVFIERVSLLRPPLFERLSAASKGAEQPHISRSGDR